MPLSNLLFISLDVVGVCNGNTEAYSVRIPAELRWPRLDFSVFFIVSQGECR
jgi:hypothetical protein